MADSTKFHGRLIGCHCGKEFYATLGQIEKGRKKYCSKACKYEFYRRPSGLVYDLKVVNPTWFERGDRPSPPYVPPKGTRFAPETEFKKGVVPANFKGDAVGYQGLHSWVRRQLGRATKCSSCASEKHVQWANISWEYRREKDDWMQLCAKCHSKYDHEGRWGAAVEKFGARS